MVNEKLHCMQLFKRYICLVTTRILVRLACATVHCAAVSYVLYIVEECFEVYDHCIRMLYITAVFGPLEFGFGI